jgi:hypothetical protein
MDAGREDDQAEHDWDFARLRQPSGQAPERSDHIMIRRATATPLHPEPFRDSQRNVFLVATLKIALPRPDSSTTYELRPHERKTLPRTPLRILRADCRSRLSLQSKAKRSPDRSKSSTANHKTNPTTIDDAPKADAESRNGCGIRYVRTTESERVPSAHYIPASLKAVADCLRRICAPDNRHAVDAAPVVLNRID